MYFQNIQYDEINTHDKKENFNYFLEENFIFHLVPIDSGENITKMLKIHILAFLVYKFFKDMGMPAPYWTMK